MKKIFCITIVLCLVFASVLPVYAEAWTYTQATSVTNDVHALITAFTGSVGTMYNSISELMSWLTPVGSFNTSHSITGVTLYEIVDYIAWTLSGVGPTVYDTFQSMGSMLAYMPSLDTKLSNIYTSINNLVPLSIGYFTDGIDYNPNLGQGRWINLYAFHRDGTLGTENSFYPQNTNILGLLPRYLGAMNNNSAAFYAYFGDKYTESKTGWIGKHYNDNLTTWDSQGSTLSQVAFTPESITQGLYRYLAFTQRDVARLAYVFANDEELEARELAQPNQEQVLDDFIDPNGSGSVSPTDFGNMTDASDGFKSNFSTNVGSSHIWDVFDNSRYNWFTQQTKNQLDTTPQTRTLKAVQDDYPTPLLDNYYNEIFGIIGVDIND